MYWSWGEIFHADQTGSYPEPNGKDSLLPAHVLESVTHQSLSPSPHFKMVSYDIQLLDPAQPLGRLTGGTITVRGRLNLAVWARKRRTSNRGNGGLWRLELPSSWSARQVVAENNRIDRGKARSGAHRWNAGMNLGHGHGAFPVGGGGQSMRGRNAMQQRFGGFYDRDVPQPQPFGGVQTLHLHIDIRGCH
jgi:hypothetical protein